MIGVLADILVFNSGHDMPIPLCLIWFGVKSIVLSMYISRVLSVLFHVGFSFGTGIVINCLLLIVLSI